MKSTMMPTQLSLNTMFARLDRLFGSRTITSRLPDKSLRVQNYAEVADRTRALAHALQGLGVKPGDRVATLCWNHNAHLECYFGIPLVGGVMHTLNLRLSGEEIAWIADHAGSTVLIVDDVLLPLYEQVARAYKFDHVIVFPFSGEVAIPDGLHNYETLLGPHRGKPFTPAPHDENDAVGLCYTSGTTGRPKGVAYSHRSTVLHSLTTSLPDHCCLRSRDRVLAVTPMFHANCWGLPYAAVMTGASMIMPGPHLHGDDLLDLIQETQPTMALGVPTIWLSLIQFMEANPGRWKLPDDMRSLVGGSAAPESLIRSFAERGVTLFQGWGMTETSPLGTISYIKPELEDVSEEEKFRLAATAGIPATLVEIRLIDDEGQETPWDGKTPGELQIRGPYITGEYFRVPADPDKHTPDGWLRTGDVAVFDRHGYMRITDRTKDLIKSGGEWISSVDMENALMSHPAVAEAAVIAIPHEKWNERPLACIVLKPGQTATAEELNQILERQFAKWQLPDRYEVLDAIPRTSTGKFFKLKLREMFPA